MSVSITKPDRMNVDQVLSWTDAQRGSDRWELLDGEVVGMAGDSVRHNRVHRRRDGSGDILTRIAQGSDLLDLAPPGLSVRVSDRLGPAPRSILEAGRS